MTLPNFVIIGAARSGTTSLYRYLSEHPDVFTSPVKETNYFAWEAERPPEGSAPIPEQMYPIRVAAAYRALFDAVSGQRAIGEASPRYLHVPGVPERLAAELPDVRLVAILREPARRAYADYMVRRRKGIESRSFEALIEAEAPRMHAPPLPGSRPILHHGLCMPICGDGSRPCRTIGYWCCCTTISPPIRATSSRGSAGSSALQSFPLRTAR